MRSCHHLIHPALLFAIAGLHVRDRLRLDMTGDAARRPGFILASRSRHRFAVSLPVPYEKSVSYEIFRHPAGGAGTASAGGGRTKSRSPSLKSIVRAGSSARRNLERPIWPGRKASEDRAGRHDRQQVRHRCAMSLSRPFRPGKILLRLP
jgi:hypothetical protein